MLRQRQRGGPGPECRISGTSGRLTAALQVSGWLTKAPPRRKQAGAGGDGRKAQLQLSTEHVLWDVVTLNAAGMHNREWIKADGNAPLHPKTLLTGEAHAHRLQPRGEPTTTNKWLIFNQPWDSNCAEKMAKHQYLSHLGGHFQDITFLF